MPLQIQMLPLLFGYYMYIREWLGLSLSYSNTVDKYNTVKPTLSDHSKIDKNKGLNGKW